MNVKNTIRFFLLVAALLFFRSNASLAQDGSAPAAAQTSVDRFQSLARECAIEIPWQFDLRQAGKTADQQGKPLLVYVRCVNNRNGYESAQQSIAAMDVPLRDDGYRKDLLFRACVLADRGVQSLVNDNFVPACLTYHFETHGRGKNTLDWVFPGKSGGDDFTIDPNVGAAARGSLH